MDKGNWNSEWTGLLKHLPFRKSDAFVVLSRIIDSKSIYWWASDKQAEQL
jgi:hypothetical protein